MNILIFSNSATIYSNVYNAIAKHLESERHNVVFASDSPLSVKKNNLLNLGFEYAVFSEYFESHVTDQKLLARYSNENTNYALLSDFDRSEYNGAWKNYDRCKYDKLKSALLSYFEGLISKHNIDCILYENISNSMEYYASLVAKRHHIKYIAISSSRLPGRFEIFEGAYMDPRRIVDGMYSSDISDEELKWADEYIGNIREIQPDYMKFNGLDRVSILKKILGKNILNYVVETIGLLQFYIKSSYWHERGNPVRARLLSFSRSLIRSFRVKVLNHMYDSPDKDDKFILYPLHFHPESSTSVLAGCFLNEYEVIKNLAFNLPQGYILYVKDHISAWGRPNLNFYNKLQKLPNVKVIHPSANTKSLIIDSCGVVTLTSTVGYEALLLNKPVMTFGDVFYNGHKNVIKGELSGNLFQLLKNLCAYDVGHNIADYNRMFVASYYRNTFSGTLNFLGDTNQISLLSKKIVQSFFLYWAKFCKDS